MQLLDRHRALEASAYGIAFALVVVHALHVVGTGVEGARESARQRAPLFGAGLRGVLAFPRSSVDRAVGRVFCVGVSNPNRSAAGNQRT